MANNIGEINFELDWNQGLEPYNPENIDHQTAYQNKIDMLIYFPYLTKLKYFVANLITANYKEHFEKLCILKDFRKTWFEPLNASKYISLKNFWKNFFPNTKKVQDLRKTFKPEDFILKTPDNTIIKGTVFHKSKNPNARTLMICTGRSQLYQQGNHSWLFYLIKQNDLDVNIVMYNPRGYGESSGTPSLQGFLIDGETVYQYIHEKLGVDENKIDIYGYSLGASTATRLKELHNHTKGKLISDRSFSDSNSQLYHGLASKLGEGIFTNFVYTVLNWTFRACGWDGSIIDEWNNISSPKLVICHPKDQVIPFKASLYNTLEERGFHSDESKILLQSKSRNDHIYDHHAEHLFNYKDENTGLCAAEILAQFLKS